MRKQLLDIPIDWISKEELLRKLEYFVVSKKPHQITTVNPEFIVLSTQNQEFKKALQQSDLSLPDGTGLVLGQTLSDSKTKGGFARFIKFLLLGCRFVFMPHSFDYKRITGVELTDMILELATKEQWRVFLLGAAPGVARKAAEIWQVKYPGLHIVGASASNPQDDYTVAEVKEKRADVLLVAYGAPKQDLFIAQHAEELKIPVMVGVGGTFDYAVGNIKLAPSWMRSLGLEWFSRLIQQPKRFKRIWNSTVTFSRLVTKSD